MAVSLQQVMAQLLPDLRTHPVDQRVRAYANPVTGPGADPGADPVVDSRRVRLVWEPRRVVPSYAVPVGDVSGDLVPFDGAPGEERSVRLAWDEAPVLDPRTPFTVHSCPGRALSITTAGGTLRGAAFAPEDPDLHGYVVLDWAAFSRWVEEEQPVVGHPHDPFDRIDCLPSSRHVVVSADGVVLADSHRPVLLLETPLPTRYYLPREDVRMDLLERSDQRTVCAYKGHAAYWSARVGDRLVRDAAWTYEEPLHDAAPVRGLVCFLTERLDLTLDGVAVARPLTPWSTEE